MEHVSQLFPQRVSPQTPLPRPAKAGILNQDLDLRRKRRIVKSTGLVATRWIPWHCNAIDVIGPNAYLDLADTAKNGTRDPKSLFSWMLKQELEDRMVVK